MTADIHLIAGARPNFMKVGPLYHALAQTKWGRPTFVHTGQHYDASMSNVVFTDVGLPNPDIHLGVGSGTHAETTGAVMIAYEHVCRERRPDWVVVVGDVDSTVAAALAAKKLGLPVAHLEAGLRSFDRTMPEEINRVITDAIADLLWTPSDDADNNLLREGIAPERIVRVGNVMTDAYEMLTPKIRASAAADDFGLTPGAYGVVTLHRPANVDDAKLLANLMRELRQLSRELPLVFPVHPRTRKMLASLDRETGSAAGQLRLIEPLGYIRFMSLVSDAALVITDSGGIQEETTYLGIPCLTVRNSTERPITVTRGTNRLVHGEEIVAVARQVLMRPRMLRPVIPLWDGHAAERAVASLAERLA